MPDRILHYQIAGDLGEGRYGHMYRAVDSIEQVEVLLEVFPRPLLSDQETRARFLEVMHRLASVDIQYLVRFYALEDVDGGQVLVREFIDGESIEQWRLGKHDSVTILDIASRAVRCLKAAHDCGVIHGHLASTEIWVDKQGQARITGFGLPSPALAGGDLPYRSPEQLAGNPPTEQSDLFALGVIFYRALTGEFPFRGDLPAQVQKAIATEKPAYSPSANRDVPPDIRLMIDNLLRYDPRERFQNCQELLVTIDEMREFHQRERRAERPNENRESPQKFMVVAFVVLVLILIWILAYNLMK